MKVTTVDELLIRKGALILRAINHPLRRDIFNYLSESGPQTVTTIYKRFSLEQSVASQHLAILRDAEFVVTERERRFVNYSANMERMAQVLDLCVNLTEEAVGV